MGNKTQTCNQSSKHLINTSINKPINTSINQPINIEATAFMIFSISFLWCLEHVLSTYSKPMGLGPTSGADSAEATGLAAS